MDYVWLTISFTIPLTTQFTIVDYHRQNWSASPPAPKLISLGSVPQDFRFSSGCTILKQGGLGGLNPLHTLGNVGCVD